MCHTWRRILQIVDAQWLFNNWISWIIVLISRQCITWRKLDTIRGGVNNSSILFVFWNYTQETMLLKQIFPNLYIQRNFRSSLEPCYSMDHIIIYISHIKLRFSGLEGSWNVVHPNCPSSDWAPSVAVVVSLGHLFERSEEL